jgi:hypothetical protein
MSTWQVIIYSVGVVKKSGTVLCKQNIFPPQWNTSAYFRHPSATSSFPQIFFTLPKILDSKFKNVLFETHLSRFRVLFHLVPSVQSVTGIQSVHWHDNKWMTVLQSHSLRYASGSGDSHPSSTDMSRLQESEGQSSLANFPVGANLVSSPPLKTVLWIPRFVANYVPILFTIYICALPLLSQFPINTWMNHMCPILPSWTLFRCT